MKQQLVTYLLTLEQYSNYDYSKTIKVHMRLAGFDNIACNQVSNESTCNKNIKPVRDKSQARSKTSKKDL